MNDRSAGAETKRKLILFVDDDNDIRLTVTSLLTNEGYTVLEAKDGRFALALVASKSPDAILSDIKMPNVGGLELLKQVRSTSQIPFSLDDGFF